MDPVLFCLPELILDDGEEPNLVSPHCQPPFPVDRSAPQEESEPSLQTSQERSHLVKDELASKRPSAVAEIPQKRAHSDQRTDDLSLTQRGSNQQSVQHLVPSLTCPIEQIPAQDSLSPLSLQALPPGAMSQPVLMPLLPAEPIGAPCWLSPITSTPNSNFGLSSCVLVPISSPVLMCCPYLPPGSLVLLPEIRPSCLCPQSVRPVHQPCAPDPVSRRAAQQVSEQQLRSESVLSGKEQTEEQVKSEEKQQKNTPGKNKLQVNNTNGKRTKSKVSPASLLCLDEETLAERAFEEYMTIMDSLTLKIPEAAEAKENEEDEDEEKTKQETENCSFLEYLEELCSDEDFARKVGSTLNIEYLESLLSAEPEPTDLLALDKQAQGVMLQSQPSTSGSINPLTEEKSLAVSKLDSFLCSDPEPADFLPLRELQQEPLETLLLQHLHPPSADTKSIIPVTEETSPATLCDQAPIQRAKLPILGPHGAQSDTNPNHNGQNAHLSMKNIESEEGWTSCAPIISLPHLEEAVSPLNRNRSPFTDYSLSSTLELLAEIFSDTQLTSDLEARDNNRLVTEPAVTHPTEDVSEEASKSLSKLTDTQSAQMPQKLQGGPLPRNPPASKAPATSSAEESYEDPNAITVKDPAPSFRADLLTISPPEVASSPALIVQASSTAQILEPEEQCCPKNRDPRPSCLEDYKVPVQANSSSMADFNAESCGPPLDGNLSDLELEKQTVEPPKGMQAFLEFASSGVSSGGRAEMDRKCEKNLEEGVEATKQTAIKARERGRPIKTPEGRGQNKEKLRGMKNKVQLRRSQRLSGQNETDKVRLSGEFIMESAKETNIKNTAKFIPERDGVTYEKQRRWSSGGRQLSKGEETHFKESSQATKTPNTAEQFYMNGEMEQHLNGSTENGVELNPDAHELGEGRVKRNEEGIQTSSFERRRTRTMATEEKVQPTPLPATRDGGKIKHSEMERGEIKSSPEREMQRANKQENATEQLLVSGQVSNDDMVFRDRSPASPPESSLQSPRVQTSTHSLKDSKDDQCRQKPCEGWLNETICEKNAPLRLILCPETQQQCKRDSSNRNGVTRTETWVFYNLRSRTHETYVSSRLGVQENKATHHPSNEDKVSGDHGPVSLPTLSLQSPRVQPQTLSTKDFLKDDQSGQESTEGLLHKRQKSPSVKSGEKNTQLSPALCPETQQQHKKVASSRDGVTKTWNFYSLRSRTLEPDVSNGTVNRTGAQENKATHEPSTPKPSRDQTAGVKDDNEAERPGLTSSPMKRCRHEYREASEERETRVDEDKSISFSPMKRGRWKTKLTWNKRGETPGRKLSPPLTRSNRKARDEMFSTLLAGQKTFGGDRRRVIETRARVRKGTNIPCSRKFPSKCKGFTLYKTNRHK